MRSKFFSKLLFLFALFGIDFLLSGCGMVQAATSTPNDGSLQLLTLLFGAPLSTSLSGSLQTDLVFPVLIHAFNMGLMSGATLIFVYVAVMGTIYSAQDGVFLGKKWSKTFIPLRAILGVILIFPIGSTGFGIAQYIIYAMTYAGVGLANSVWQAVATDAQPGGLAPGIPLSVLQGIDSSIGQMVFYDVTSSITGNGSINPTTQLSQTKRLYSAVPCPSGTSTSGVKTCVTGVVPMTKFIFNKMNTSTGSSNSILSGILNSTTYTSGSSPSTANAACNTKTWCQNAIAQIQSNLNNPSIPDDSAVGNISYLVTNESTTTTSINSTTSITSVDSNDFSITQGDIGYIQTDFWLAFNGEINNLPPPPSSLNLSTPISDDPVTAAYNLASKSASTITGSSSADALTVFDASTAKSYPYLFSQTSFLDKLSGVLTDLVNYYGDSGSGSSSHSAAPENFSNSWWLAGDEYLYLDQIFAKETADLTGIVKTFETAVTGDTKNLIQVTSGGVLANLTRFNLASVPVTSQTSSNEEGVAYEMMTTVPKYAQITDCGAFSSSTSSAGCAYILYKPTSSFFAPVSLTNFLTTLSTTSSGWTANSNAQLAAKDLICKFQGTGCSDSNLIAYLGAIAPGKVPHLLDSTSGPIPVIQQNLFYYFSLRSSSGTPVTPQEIYQLDLALNYAYNAYETSNSSDPCPSNQGMVSGSSKYSCNPNSPGWANPMIIAGQNSPVGNVMGFVFSGLVGAQNSSGVNVPGLMAQIWCVGEVDFGTCISEAQSSSISDQGSIPSSGIVTAHFDVIANAQLVGINLIGGSVAALTSIFTTFGDKMKAVITTLTSKGTDDPTAGQWALMAIPGFGGIATASYSSDLVDATTEASLQIAQASVGLMWLPVIMIVLTTLFTTGVMFSVFIPILPFVLFWAGKIAWILLVIEAIFAAPLMALAIAYPEGHDLWGMGEQGFKTSLNLLLFPVLMIVGLVSSMAITYYILNITASGFHYVANSLLQMANISVGGSSIIPAAPSNIGYVSGVNALLTRGIMSTFLIFMYASFISMAFSKSFSTIYVIPERVMGWIGAQGMKFGEKEGGEMQGAVSKQADQAAQAGGQAVSQGTQAEKGVAESQTSKYQQEGQAEMQIGSSIGQATTTVVTTAAGMAG